MARLNRWFALVAMVLVLGACAREAEVGGPAVATSSPEAAAPRMPDLIGAPEPEIGPLLGSVDDRLIRGSDWRTTTVRCEARPGTVVRQRPAPGTPLERPVLVRIRTAALDLDEFRGPCEPIGGDLGPVRGEDALLARQFYRFAADPSLGAPFTDGDVWVGIENGEFTETHVSAADRADLAAWTLQASYAEQVGPFSALDTAAGSGGYYRLRRGVPRSCLSARATGAPAELVDLRAISLTAPKDTVSSCMQWWAVTLFVDGDDRIRGVALRLGSP